MTIYDDIIAQVENARSLHVELDITRGLLEEQITELEHERGGLLTEMADLRRQLADCLPDTGSNLVGVWPYGPDVRTLSQVESELGVTFDGFRPRGGVGSFEYAGWTVKDGYVAPPPSDAIATEPPYKPAHTSLGRFLSLDLTPKAGSGTKRYSARCRDILDGRWDAIIDQHAQHLAALTVPATLEVWSEANVGDPAPAPQPAPPDPELIPEAIFYITARLKARGATSKMVLTLTHGPYQFTGWERYWTTQNRSAMDIVGVDGYDKSGARKTPAEMFDRPAQVASELGKPLGIFETGSAEYGDGGTKKALWIDELRDWCLAHRPHSLWLNHGDSSTGPYRLTTSPAAREASSRLVGALQS